MIEMTEIEKTSRQVQRGATCHKASLRRTREEAKYLGVGRLR